MSYFQARGSRFRRRCRRRRSRLRGTAPARARGSVLQLVPCFRPHRSFLDIDNRQHGLCDGTMVHSSYTKVEAAHRLIPMRPDPGCEDFADRMKVSGSADSRDSEFLVPQESLTVRQRHHSAPSLFRRRRKSSSSAVETADDCKGSLGLVTLYEPSETRVDFVFVSSRSYILNNRVADAMMA